MKYNIEVNGTRIVSIISYFNNIVNEKYITIETELSHIDIITNHSWVNNELLFTGPAPSGYHIYDAVDGWMDTRSLQIFKDIKWQEIKEARSSAESAGFTWEGSTFDSDTLSQSRIAGAVQLALLAQMASQPFSITWTLSNGDFRSLSTTDMLAIGVALGNHVQTQFNKGRQLQTQIEAATSKEELDLITWE